MSASSEDAARRSAAEQVVFAIALAVVLAIAGVALALELSSDHLPPTFTVIPVTTGRPAPTGDVWTVRLSVRNDGDEAAQEVLVVGTLTVGPDEHQGEVVLDFLSGGEAADVELAFPADPAEGELDVRVAGWRLP